MFSSGSTGETERLSCGQRVGCGKVFRMFAHSIQNWWWTASPAAH
ncbi:trp operon leader peptide [Streptomyces sp. NPDC047061]